MRTKEIPPLSDVDLLAGFFRRNYGRQAVARFLTLVENAEQPE